MAEHYLLGRAKRRVDELQLAAEAAQRAIVERREVGIRAATAALSLAMADPGLTRVPLMKAVAAAKTGSADPEVIAAALELKKKLGFRKDVRRRGTAGAGTVRPPLPPHQLQMNSENEEEDSFECMICMEVKHCSQRMHLQCSHSFCPCVREWLRVHRSCPVCRMVAHAASLTR